MVGQVEQAAAGGLLDDEAVEDPSTTCSRSVRKRSTASLDGGRSKPQLSQTTVFWSSRVTGRMP